jgi:hypothetical protein
LVVVALAGWNLSVIFLSYLIALGLVAGFSFVCRQSQVESIGSVGGKAEGLPLVVATAIGLVVLMLFIPLNNAGRLTADGYAFAGLFSHDFILRATDSVALANGIPSDNYFFNGVKTYNYYVLWYILPATIYNLLSKQAEIAEVVSLVTVLSVPAFCALLYYTLAKLVGKVMRTSTPYDPIRLGFIFAALLILSYSYHWIFFVITQSFDLSDVPLLANISKQMGPVSTSWYKDFLFQPHSVLAMMQVLVLMHLASGSPSRLRGAALGLLLASLLLTDTIVFLIVGSALGLYYALNRHTRDHIGEAVIGTLTVATVVALSFGLNILVIPEYSNKLAITPYISLIATLPVFVILVFGPLPVFAIAGLKPKANRFVEEQRFLLILLFVSLLFMLFVTETIEGNVFLRKSLMLLRLPLFILAASYIYSSSFEQMKKISLLVLILAAPTAVTDVYATSNIRNKQYTSFVTLEEMGAASWIKTNTAPDVVVQSLIDYAGVFDYSLTICFGQRKAALGLWKMAYQRYPNKSEITRRVYMIDTIFSSDDRDERYRIARALKIDYFLIGPRENTRYPGASARFSTDPRHFTQVYASENVAIFQVRSNL